MSETFRLSCLLLLVCITVPSSFGGSQYAVTVGVETYDPGTFANLKYAEDDASELGRILRRYGYATTVMTSVAESAALRPATASNIRKAVRHRCETASPGDTLIVSLSGHGIQFKDEAELPSGVRETYFCPETADLSDKSTLLPISELQKLIADSKATRKLLLVDACRNQVVSQAGQNKAAATRIEVDTVHESRRSVPGGMSVLFSCQNDEVSWESNELGHSVFSYFVTRYLSKRAESRYYDRGQVSLDGLVAYVRKKTNDFVFDSNLSNQGQFPVLRGESADWSFGELSHAIGLFSEWMQYRGPDFGRAADSLPTTWSMDSNLRWKASLRSPDGDATNGNSSPIVVGDRVYLTADTGRPGRVKSATADDSNASGSSFIDDSRDLRNAERFVYCFNRLNGDLVWRQPVPVVLGVDEQEPGTAVRRHELATFSDSSLASDGRVIVGFFGSAGLWAFDTNGNVLWKKSLGEGTHTFGSGGSPILHNGKVYVCAAVESSAFYCLDAKSGSIEWKFEFDDSRYLGFYTTPVVLQNPAGDQIVLKLTAGLLGLSAEYGTQLWFTDEVRVEGCCATSAPIIHEATIFTTSEHVFQAHGDRVENGPQSLPRPPTQRFGSIQLDDRLYYFTNSVETVVDRSTGEEISRARTPTSRLATANVQLSQPVAAGGHIYLQRENGAVIVYRPVSTGLERVAVNRVDVTGTLCHASPAISDGEFFYRTDDYLYCIAESK